MRRPIRSDQSIACLNLEVTGIPQFSVYQIMAGPTRVARFDDSAGPETLHEDDHMITKRRFVSLACTGSLAAIFPDAIPTAGAQTFRACWWASVPAARST